MSVTWQLPRIAWCLKLAKQQGYGLEYIFPSCKHYQLTLESAIPKPVIDEERSANLIDLPGSLCCTMANVRSKCYYL
jgi:hypothetical protein